MRGADKKATRRARELRSSETEAERKLWRRLANRQLAGWKFVRQEPIGPYFADFVCREATLVVELDGSQHADSEHDRVRDAFLRARGYRILRFWNHEAVRDMEGVLDTVFAALGGERGAAPVSAPAPNDEGAPHPVASRLDLSPQPGRGGRA
jgi:very-short-patch-repair endonuclease